MRLAFVLGIWVLAGCGPADPGAVAGATGVVEGIVRLGGSEEIEPTRIENTTDPEVCGRGQTLDDLTLSVDRGVGGVIVTVVGFDESNVSPPAPEHVTIDNEGCRFSPHASVTTVGSTLEAVNSDAVLHTTHLYGPADMNISLPVQGARASRELTRPGLYIVKCDVHGWMQAFVRVDPHALHAVTDADGAFRIEGVPTGAHRIELWHERLGTREVDVEVRPDRTARVDFTIPFPMEENP